MGVYDRYLEDPYEKAAEAAEEDRIAAEKGYDSYEEYLDDLKAIEDDRRFDEERDVDYDDAYDYNNDEPSYYAEWDCD